MTPKRYISLALAIASFVLAVVALLCCQRFYACVAIAFMVVFIMNLEERHY